uniref:Uncharacterized protein n=1 Tax=Onchocerca volvulus TaxID=6282 RepID=A0A8R1TQ18_ONCVO
MEMFEEKEPGKPKNWGYTVTLIALIMLLNITVIIVCRILLDSHDENNNLWLEGSIRENLTFFLGMFALSFCFFCCCCFCCGGSLCRWIGNFHRRYFDPSKLFSTTVKITDTTPAINKRQKNSFAIFKVSNNGDCMMVDVSDIEKPYSYVNGAFRNSSEHRSINKTNFSRNILMPSKEELVDYSKFNYQCGRRKSL